MVNGQSSNLGATIIEDFEALEAAVTAFFALYETPSKLKLAVAIDPLERFGPYLDSPRLDILYTGAH
jgi:hypothetical protein